MDASLPAIISRASGFSCSPAGKMPGQGREPRPAIRYAHQDIRSRISSRLCYLDRFRNPDGDPQNIVESSGSPSHRLSGSRRAPRAATLGGRCNGVAAAQEGCSSPLSIYSCSNCLREQRGICDNTQGWRDSVAASRVRLCGEFVIPGAAQGPAGRPRMPSMPSSDGAE